MREYTVIYDGHCNVCQRIVRGIEKWDRNDLLEIIPSQLPGVPEHHLGGLQPVPGPHVRGERVPQPVRVPRRDPGLLAPPPDRGGVGGVRPHRAGGNCAGRQGGA